MNLKSVLIRLTSTLALTVGALGVSATAALAAPPGNDLFPGATPATIGFSATLNTTEATTDADDAQLNNSCGAPATDASVWYSFTGADNKVVVDVSQSDYSAGVLVGTGTQGNLDTVSCGPNTVGFFAAAGTTYYVLAIDSQEDGVGNGGNLNISFNEAPAAPTVDVTVNSVGSVKPRTGIATISGTYTCTNGDFIDVYGEATQSAGRANITGFFDIFDVGTCDGTARKWVADVSSDNGSRFVGGKAMTVTFAFTCGVFECSEGYVEQTVMLRGKR